MLQPCSSTSDIPSEFEVLDKECQVCNQPAHGRHFGAITCRACAAFFRRTKTGRNLILECFENDKCRPSQYGKWKCKKCRLKKCFSLGMTPENIQYNRDLFRNSDSFNEEKKKKLVLQDRIPTTLERVLGKPHIVVFLNRDDPLDRRKLTFIDLSEILERVEALFVSQPKMEKCSTKLTTLEKMALALKEVRKTQKAELSEIKIIGKDENMNFWDQDLMKVATWIKNSDAFGDLSIDIQMSLFKAMWHLWTKMERVAMTAEMRVNRMCGKKQFVVSHDSVIDLDSVREDCSWHSPYTSEEMRLFVNPYEYHCDQLVERFLDLQPTEVEITFIICNLCFQLTGKRLGGEVEVVTDRLLDTISNDIHQYYAEKNGFPRYAYRLNKLLGICNDYQRLMHQRQDKMHVASALNAFRIGFSHPEMFMFSH